MRVLLLGGSTEATGLARALAGDARFDVTLSLAGRTENPKAQPVAMRIGGFGGVAGLADYVETNRIGALIDATHPFASQISRHAIEACKLTQTPLLAVERPAWQPSPEDHWVCVPDIAAGVAALGETSRTVFCGIGKLALNDLRAAPQHRYVIRLIDKPTAPLGLPHVTIVQARGPFSAEDDIELFRAHGVEAVMAKNSGGSATVSKIEAARALSLPVIMVERPFIPPRPTVTEIGEALAWLGAHYESSAERGV
jgi:precorrin-6A/cobalt-precorrin-6A reductase